jgi:ArsR family transcriptional regulator
MKHERHDGKPRQGQRRVPIATLSTITINVMGELPSMQTKQAITILAALAQESRLAVYRLLIEHAPDGLAASVIAEKLGLPNATLSFHLKELAHAGLVSSQPSGRFIYYAPVIEVMNELIGYLTDHCCSQSSGRCVTTTAICKPGTSKKPRKQTPA